MKKTKPETQADNTAGAAEVHVSPSGTRYVYHNVVPTNQELSTLVNELRDIARRLAGTGAIGPELRRELAARGSTRDRVNLYLTSYYATKTRPELYDCLRAVAMLFGKIFGGNAKGPVKRLNVAANFIEQSIKPEIITPIHDEFLEAMVAANAFDNVSRVNVPSLVLKVQSGVGANLEGKTLARYVTQLKKLGYADVERRGCFITQKGRDRVETVRNSRPKNAPLL